LNGIRNDYHNALAAANQVEVQHGARVEELENSIQQKTEELEKMRESVRRRDKQTADEWIQRETALMTQFSSQNQETTSNYETKLAALAQELETTRVTAQSMKKERDEARDDIAVFQIQTEAQLSALNEQYDQERSMLLGKMAESHALQMNELHTKVAESQAALEQVRRDQSIQLKQLEQEHRDAILMAVQDAMEPLDDELNELRKERQAYLLLQKEYEELKDRIEPFRVNLKLNSILLYS
jgi:chromosome segregation ATPase